MKLSVIIPSYKDKNLNKTIESILTASTCGSIEVIPVLDGYIQEVLMDTRVKPVYILKNAGMREAINTGVKMSSGEYIMRSDEHCIFGYGFDSIILESIEDNWIVVPRRFFLDTEKWELMGDRFIDYEKLVIKENPHKFTSVEWISRSKERRHILVDETMAMQGSCWIMKRTWWDKVIGRLDSEGYGTHYQDSTEMIFKTWLAGGKLMLNKETWYAHKHRDFNRTHQYPHEKAIPEWEFALNKWKPEYEKVRVQWGI